MRAKIKTAVDKYFLEVEHPFTRRKKIQTGRLKVVLYCVSGLSITIILVAGNSVEKKTETTTSRNDTEVRRVQPNTPDSAHFYEERLAKAPISSPRNYGATQIVRRNGRNAPAGDGLPMGTTFRARLVNTVLTTDSDSPVIAEITDDVLWENQVVIPTGTRAIGSGSLDDSTERLKCRFHTLVFPDGSQHSLSGLALNANGSSGIEGNYHSQRLRKHSGKMLGDFISGTAQGLKERRSEGQVGLTHEPGTLRNGILNGVASSTLDYANSYSDDMKNIHPYLEVQEGSSFLIYLEKEYMQ